MAVFTSFSLKFCVCFFSFQFYHFSSLLFFSNILSFPLSLVTALGCKLCGLEMVSHNVGRYISPTLQCCQQTICLCNLFLSSSPTCRHFCVRPCVHTSTPTPIACLQSKASILLLKAHNLSFAFPSLTWRHTWVKECILRMRAVLHTNTQIQHWACNTVCMLQSK